MLIKTKKYIGLLNDYYGGLLTEYQSEIVRLYYDMDMSLAEIGDELQISRQGVKDVLRRAEKKLEEYESKLGLFRKLSALTDRLTQLLNKSQNEGISTEIENIIKEVTEI